jgi:acetyl esterase/lipase
MQRFLAASIALLITALSSLGHAETEGVDIESDIVYGHKDGLAMTLDVFTPRTDANGAGVLFIVSGGWRSVWFPPEQSMPIYAPFLEAGYTVFSVRHGSSPRYGIPDAIGDVQRAVRFVRKETERFAVDPDRLAAIGNSAGGHLALVLGTQGDDGRDEGDAIDRTSSRVAAVVAWVPPTDLTIAVWDAPESLPVYRRFPALDLPIEQARQHSPLFSASEDDAPALMIMGGADELVPAFHGERMAEAFEREGVAHELIVFDDAGHGLGGALNAERVVRHTLDWLDQHLLAGATELTGP